MYNQFPYSSFNPNSLNMFQNLPSQTGTSGILGLTKKAFNWDSFLNNAQRTLNVINQAMPIYNQVKPMFKNMGTIFRVIGELNSAPVVTQATSSALNTSAASASSVPQFFA